MTNDKIREIFESTFSHLILDRDNNGFYSFADNETLWSGFRTGILFKQSDSDILRHAILDIRKSIRNNNENYESNYIYNIAVDALNATEVKHDG